jgi:putative ABC transport system permease protein
VRVPPAAAMQPQAPTSFRPTIVERLGLGAKLPLMLRMVLRHLERRPLRSLLSILAIACAAALLIIGRYSIDAIDEVVRLQFQQARREDMQVHFTEPKSRVALHDLAAIAGVTRAEPFRYIGVRMHYGHRSKRAAIEAVEPDAQLRRMLDSNQLQHPMPTGALIMSARLARSLGVKVGEMVDVEVLEGRRLLRQMPVAGLIDEYLGQLSYTALASIASLTGEAESISGANLAVDSLHRDSIMQQLKQTPVTAAVGLRQAAIESFYATIARNMLIMTGMLISFACAIAAGVIYNGARISLSEHAIELATLRILGFTKNEVGWLLLGEQAVLIAVATPLGCLLGYLISGWLTTIVGGENFQLPWVVGRATYWYAVAVVLGSALVSAVIVLRRLHRFDLVEALKARE